MKTTEEIIEAIKKLPKCYQIEITKVLINSMLEPKKCTIHENCSGDSEFCNDDKGFSG